MLLCVRGALLYPCGTPKRLCRCLDRGIITCVRQNLITLPAFSAHEMNTTKTLLLRNNIISSMGEVTWPNLVLMDIRDNPLNCTHGLPKVNKHTEVISDCDEMSTGSAGHTTVQSPTSSQSPSRTTMRLPTSRRPTRGTTTDRSTTTAMSRTTIRMLTSRRPTRGSTTDRSTSMPRTSVRFPTSGRLTTTPTFNVTHVRLPIETAGNMTITVNATTHIYDTAPRGRNDLIVAIGIVISLFVAIVLIMITICIVLGKCMECILCFTKPCRRKRKQRNDIYTGCIPMNTLTASSDSFFNIENLTHGKNE